MTHKWTAQLLLAQAHPPRQTRGHLLPLSTSPSLLSYDQQRLCEGEAQMAASPAPGTVPIATTITTAIATPNHPPWTVPPSSIPSVGLARPRRRRGTTTMTEATPDPVCPACFRRASLSSPLPGRSTIRHCSPSERNRIEPSSLTRYVTHSLFSLSPRPPSPPGPSLRCAGSLNISLF
jgi:hypothetical protein